MGAPLRGREAMWHELRLWAVPGLQSSGAMNHVGTHLQVRPNNAPSTLRGERCSYEPCLCQTIRLAGLTRRDGVEGISLLLHELAGLWSKRRGCSGGALIWSGPVTKVAANLCLGVEANKSHATKLRGRITRRRNRRRHTDLRPRSSPTEYLLLPGPPPADVL